MRSRTWHEHDYPEHIIQIVTDVEATIGHTQTYRDTYRHTYKHLNIQRHRDSQT